MILASILITENEQEEVELPALVADNIKSFKEAHPYLQHSLFTMNSIRELISKNFDLEVLRAFEKLKPFTYKADLAKHCIMYVYGGVYADIGIYFFLPWSTHFLASLNDSTRKISVNSLPVCIFRDFFSSTVWDTVSGLYSAPPRHNASLLAIEMICENVRKEYYGRTALCPTGPTLFGKAIALSCSSEEVICGDSVTVEPQGDLSNVIRTPSHGFRYKNRLVAVRRKTGGGPQSELGISGGNSYVPMWRSRNIYN